MALANRPAALPSHAGSGVSAHLGYSKLALLPGEGTSWSSGGVGPNGDQSESVHRECGKT